MDYNYLIQYVYHVDIFDLIVVDYKQEILLLDNEVNFELSLLEMMIFQNFYYVPLIMQMF